MPLANWGKIWKTQMRHNKAGELLAAIVSERAMQREMASVGDVREPDEAEMEWLKKNGYFRLGKLWSPADRSETIAFRHLPFIAQVNLEKAKGK